ncbi:MAG TPA: DUF4012 domain-containing protein [Candidatus Woesebacteria bacterium]|nr:DUF4012 domain-containing protein [Candidatus Woesebacteria bacterium]
MKLITETSENDIKILIISKSYSFFVVELKKELQKMHAEVFSSIGDSIDYLEYDVIFFVDFPTVLPSEFIDHTDKKIIYIFSGLKELAQQFSDFSYEYKLQHIKVILLQSSAEYIKKDIETILWFAFSRTVDIYLHIYHQEKLVIKKKIKKQFKLPRISLRKLVTPKYLIILGIVCLFATHILFIPPLAFASLMHFYAGKHAMQQDMATTSRYLAAADSSLAMAESLYTFPRSTLHFFSIALFPEDILSINTSVNKSLHTIVELHASGTQFADLLTIKEKTDVDTEKLYKLKDQILMQVEELHTQLVFLEAKTPEWNQELVIMKNQLTKMNNSLEHLEELTPHVDTLFGRDKEKKYLLMLANNMELRPGGGFIGSFAIVNMKDYSITDMRVYDVYDADGQLTEQIDPPRPIVDYLNQTHFFLRDSAFTPDFVTNYQEAKRFVELELHETDFDGGILLTTTAVQNLLTAMDGLYIPDYKDTITNDNFYIKTQLYAEEDFFPGSQQKKRFLASVMNQMLIELPQASFTKLLEMTEKSLNEKQIVMHMDDPQVEAFIEENYWSGRTLTPQCNLDDAYNCVLDFVLPFDANLGVNKANFFVERPTKLDISVNENGEITNTLTIQYKNGSYEDVYPGGIYKNYFQTYLPPNTRIRSVTVNDVEVKRYDETNFDYKTVGFLVEIPPQDSKIVKIVYTLPTTIISGDGIYQLIFQKQIGSPNYDFQVSFSFPNTISIKNRNFSPLVKDNKILYNTSISSDKIFVIEFSKN